MRNTHWKFWLAAANTALVLAATPALAADQLRDVPAFTSITSQGAFQVTVNVGQKQSVALSGTDTALAKIETKVVDGVLTLTMQEHKNAINDEKMVRITINVEQLNQFQMEGAGKTELNNIAAERFRLNYQGVGLLRATGKVQTFVLKAEGVGAVNARDLEAQHVDVNLQGVGSVKVWAKESLRAKVDGIGSLTYYGKPSRISKTVDGIGSISAGD
ncbi:MAG: DUF2807 domain-containing protein [Comamonadaceae bacterium PBBC2]|nr:MAG: DUF2807 domain-containing protein [Comamonadaceae bacterium PBBC2]